MYFITALTKEVIENISCDEEDKVKEYRKTFGFFSHSYKIVDLLKTEDFHEGKYDYLVIEEIEEGIHSPAIIQIWYQWIENQWISIDAPKYMKEYLSIGDGTYFPVARIG